MSKAVVLCPILVRSSFRRSRFEHCRWPWGRGTGDSSGAAGCAERTNGLRIPRAPATARKECPPVASTSIQEGVSARRQEAAARRATCQAAVPAAAATATSRGRVGRGHTLGPGDAEDHRWGLGIGWAVGERPPKRGGLPAADTDTTVDRFPGTFSSLERWIEGCGHWPTP